MTTPTTELDPAVQRPRYVSTGWDEACRVLEDAQLSWLTTVRADGRPHVTPLVAVWLDGALHVCTGADEQKAVNLRTNPEVVVTTGCDRWDEGLDVIVEGRAERVTDAAVLARLAEAWRSKWDGRWQFTVGDGGFEHEDGGTALVFSIAPAKVLAFGKGAFTHTRHRF